MDHGARPGTDGGGNQERRSTVQHGDFYASTGVTLADYSANAKQIVVKIDGKRSGARYKVQLIGKDGRLLQETAGATVTYSIQGNELYVRAKITDSNGKMAWT